MRKILGKNVVYLMALASMMISHSALANGFDLKANVSLGLTVKVTPSVDPDTGHLGPAEEVRVYPVNRALFVDNDRTIQIDSSFTHAIDQHRETQGRISLWVKFSSASKAQAFREKLVTAPAGSCLRISARLDDLEESVEGYEFQGYNVSGSDISVTQKCD